MFDEGLQLTQPVTIPPSMAGWWYVDRIRCGWVDYPPAALEPLWSLQERTRASRSSNAVEAQRPSADQSLLAGVPGVGIRLRVCV